MDVLPYGLQQIADELDVPLQDVCVVAAVELIEPDEYDSETDTVSERGRILLRRHFAGGTDP